MSIIRKIFENKEENKNKKIVYSEKNSEKGEITYVNKFIHNKASLNFFFQITMNSENNFLRI